MPSVPRIVVVDPSYDVARIVRGAMILLNRPHIMIEVPTAEDALDEILKVNTALVVTTYHLPGGTHGIELATRLSRDSLGTAVIVLAEEGDPLLDPQALKDAPFQYFMRPVAEPFLRGLRIALDGEEAVTAMETSSAKPDLDLGPVPAIDTNRLRDTVTALMRDVGAMGIILADRTGRVLIDQGATGYVDREKLAVILGPSFARSAEVSPLIGGNAWTMQYYDGERLDVFGLALGVHYFMCLIFEGSSRAFGSVTVFGRRAADQMIEIIGEAAYLVKKPEPLPLSKPAEVRAAAPAPKVEEPETAPARGRKKKKETIETAALADAQPSAGNLDLDALFGQAVDEGLADSMFDPDNLTDLAASLASSGERVGYDEAVDMGILDE